MFRPGASFLLELSADGMKQRSHLRSGAAGMLQQNGIPKIEILKSGDCFANLALKSFTERIGGAARIHWRAQFSGQLA